MMRVQAKPTRASILPESRLPLLVTGISGVAGFNALHYFQKRYPGRVVGIRPLQTPQLVGEGILPFDSENATGMRELFQSFGFRSVVVFFCWLVLMPLICSE